MNLLGLSVVALIGLILAVSGIVGVVYHMVRYRRTEKKFEADEEGPSDTPPNTFATFYLLNGFIHIGFLLLTIGGVGLIFYGQR
jgi:hypothetical protein